jgi:hypothetical protein
MNEESLIEKVLKIRFFDSLGRRNMHERVCHKAVAHFRPALRRASI